MHMSRAEAIEIRIKQLSGAHVDKDALQIAVLVIARTVHEPEKKIRKRAGRLPNADNLPGAGQELAWAAQKECANRALLANLSKQASAATLLVRRSEWQALSPAAQAALMDAGQRAVKATEEHRRAQADTLAEFPKTRLC